MQIPLRIPSLIFVFIAMNFSVCGQLDQNTWFLGGSSISNSNLTQAGIRFDFNSNVPTQYNEIRYPLKLQENNIIVSNPNNGDVILYSDGQIIVDGSHNPMPNGMDLSGSPSAMYGTAIVFDPSGCDRYFQFVVEDENDDVPRKIYYSIIDLNLSGNGTAEVPLGDVDINYKNIDFTPEDVDCSEGLFAIPKYGKTKDSWLFFGDRRTSDLYIYEVTASGVSFYNKYDLKSLFPTMPSGEIFDVKLEYFSESGPNGRLIIAPGRNTNQATYPIGSFNFNKETGTIDQDSYLLLSNETFFIYGLAFSPDGSKLYFSDYISKQLKQFDFNTNTLYTIGTASHSGRTGGLQIGPDGKIYWASAFVINWQSTSISNLSVVNSPNLSGQACDLDLNGWEIGANINPTLLGALPSFGKFPKAPIAHLINPEFCGLENGSAYIDPNDSQPPLTYEWDNGETDATASALSEGLHDVTVTDGYGCQRIITVFVPLVNEEIQTEIIGDSSICASGNTSTILTADGDFDSYLWSNGEITKSIEVDMPGVYTLIVSDNGFCSGEANIEISTYNFDIEILGNSVVCLGGGNTLTLEIEDEYESYSWSNLDNTPSIMIDQAGEYSVTVTNAEGCTAEDTLSVLAVAPPIGSSYGDSSICDFGNTSATIGINEDFASYHWSTGQTTQEIEVNSEGFYFVEFTDSLGCSNELSIEVFLDSLELNLGEDVLFCKQNFDSLTLNPGEDFITYSWSDLSTNSTLTVYNDGLYSVEVSDDKGCIATDSIEIVLAPSPEPVIVGENSICKFGRTFAALSVLNTYSDYLWSNGDNFNNTEITSPGLSSVIVTDDNGCSAMTYINITEEIDSVEILGPEFICSNNIDVIDIRPNREFESYIWSTGEISETISINYPGNYILEATNSNGCIAKDSIQIDLIEAPTMVDLPEFIEIEYGESTTLKPIINSDHPFEVMWVPSEYLSCETCISPFSKPLENIIYQITVENNYGCLDSAKIEIRVSIDKNIYYPNVISPNGDGTNDFFTLYGKPELGSILKLQIFDRWGELVFENRNFDLNSEQLGWNGEFNGNFVNPGVFVWLAEVEFIDGTRVSLSNDLLLIR